MFTMSPLARQHVGTRLLYVKDRRYVCRGDRSELRGRVLDERLGNEDACVVDEVSDPPERSFAAATDLLCRRAFADVTGTATTSSSVRGANTPRRADDRESRSRYRRR